MLPVLSTLQIKKLEALAMERASMSALDLMERAGSACARRIIALKAEGAFRGADQFVVIVGMGNNGGDGLVIARLLKLGGFKVRVLRILHRTACSPENTINHDRLVAVGGDIHDIDHSSSAIELDDNVVIIDALFGAGFTAAPKDRVTQVMAMITRSGRPVVSIDMPSGMVAPEVGVPFDPALCVRTDHTLTFEVPKLGLLLSGIGECAGQFDILPIGLNAEEWASSERIGEWVRSSDLHSRLLPRPKFGHKGTFGHALVVAGSCGMYGAALLALKGCLRSGVGSVTGHVPGEALAAILSIAPDAMCSGDPCSDHVTVLPALDRFDAVAIGPGMGQHPDTAAFVEQCLRSIQVPMILDADALNLLALNTAWFELLGPNTILTPHSKEMDRLLGSASGSSYERLHRTRTFAQRHGCFVVLKGAYSVTCAPDGSLYFNSTGNAGMAKGGSGDVLTGLLGGLLAQGYSTLDACLIGVYLHGSAGDIAAQTLGMDAMRPSDLVNALPMAWKTLRRPSEEAVQ